MFRSILNQSLRRNISFFRQQVEYTFPQENHLIGYHKPAKHAYTIGLGILGLVSSGVYYKFVNDRKKHYEGKEMFLELKNNHRNLFFGSNFWNLARMYRLEREYWKLVGNIKLEPNDRIATYDDLRTINDINHKLKWSWDRKKPDGTISGTPEIIENAKTTTKNLIFAGDKSVSDKIGLNIATNDTYEIKLATRLDWIVSQDDTIVFFKIDPEADFENMTVNSYNGRVNKINVLGIIKA